MDDLTLLRTFEPVVRYTRGEMFFPTYADEYVRHCSLWSHGEKGELLLVAEGNLTAEKLAEFGGAAGKENLYLRFVGRPLDPVEYQRWLARPDRVTFQAAGRLARVGLFPRVLQALTDASLFARGKVPGGTVAAGQIKYEEMLRQKPGFVYYGRVLRESGYIVLQYFFFYAINDWRSTFSGVNDHESDWEQILIYLSEDAAGSPAPRWAAYASHDFSGDDLRRRWDDPELVNFEGVHPVVFAGAGSHASYFEPGEYLMGAPPTMLVPLRNAVVALRKFWMEGLRQGKAGERPEDVEVLFNVPYVDYARGDGASIGPGQPNAWTPVLLTSDLGWVEKYRGLWGLDTRDPLGGERAPGGPKFNRDRSVRSAWYDPLGWAGLDKVIPSEHTIKQLEDKLVGLAREMADARKEHDEKQESVRWQALEMSALRGSAHPEELRRAKEVSLLGTQRALQALSARRNELDESQAACRAYLGRLKQGDLGDPQAHVRGKHRPEPPVPRQTMAIQWWAALSAGLLMLALVALIGLAPSYWPFWLVLIGVVFAGIERAIRGRLSNYLLTVTIVLAVITGLLLIKDFLREILMLGIVALALLTIRENLQDLRKE